jgi:diguanylate cyclase (GGDEF)-like protein
MLFAALSAIVAVTPALAGCLLLLSWLQHPRQVALGVWGSGFLTASMAAILIVVARGSAPDFWSIVIGNGLFAASYGLLWCGTRTFEGKAISLPLAFLGTLAWLAACSISPIYSGPEFRAFVMAMIGICYTLLAALELWRGRGDGLWRWPIITLLLGHAILIPLRIPLAGAWRHPDPADVDLLIFTVFEAAFVSICGAYLLGGLVKDRIVAGFRNASLIDPLTNVTNRRGFFEIGERLLAQLRSANRPVALVMFDLDRFKRINDRFGHATGDEVLIAFCRLATLQLRTDDIFARIGGEEFAALLPNTTLEDASCLAERVRAAIEGASHMGGCTMRATVSVGVASLDEGTTDLAAFLRAADHALYRAKQGGRNRVELSSSKLKRASGEHSHHFHGQSAA